MISEPGDGRIYVTTPDGLWSFNSSAHNVPRAAFDALRERCGKLERVSTELAKQLKAQDFALEHILDALDIDPEETHIDIKSGDSVVLSVSIAELHSRAEAALAATEVKP